MSEIYCTPQYYEEEPDLKFFLKEDGTEISVSDIVLSSGGQVMSITDTEGKEYQRDSFDVCKNFLHVPGIGYFRSGCVVKLNGRSYSLNYGDHVNISNQRIISWYLTPECFESDPDPLGRVSSSDVTLSVDDINKICLVTFL